MGAPRNGYAFAEVEAVLNSYFDSHIVPVMDEARKELEKKYVSDYMSAQKWNMNPSRGISSVPAQYSVEDYVNLCSDRLMHDATKQRDLSVIADELRTLMVAEVGQERYAAMCEDIQYDVAMAYVGYRIDKLTFDKLVADDIPRSGIEYFLRELADSSLSGMVYSLGTPRPSSMGAAVRQEANRQYAPSAVAKWGARAAGSVLDSTQMFIWNPIGMLGWMTFDLGVNAVGDHLNKSSYDTSFEGYLSEQLFGTGSNEFDAIHQKAKSVTTSTDPYVQQINGELTKKVSPVRTGQITYDNNNNNTYSLMSNFEEEIRENNEWVSAWAGTDSSEDTSGNNSEDDIENRYSTGEIPYVVVPDRIDEYDAGQAEIAGSEYYASHEQNFVAQSVGTPDGVSPSSSLAASPSPATSGDATAQAAQGQSSSDGTGLWDNLFSSLGLSGLGEVLHFDNLPSVLANLPDLVIGLFTGKTKSLDWNNSFLPLAAIVGGMLTKNPLLKMLLIGVGGSNLLNKGGHEILDKTQGGVQHASVQYKSYADEPLNPRIANPVLRGTSLIADIDGDPCTIQLTQTVVDAYNAGALPLNTLANAVLAKDDAMRSAIARNYEENDQRSESVMRRV